MIVLKRREVPTGDILVVEGESNKPLELLSIGDYGKEKNLKADFLGLTKEIQGVPHGKLLSLEEKWVITISSQYGCSMNCRFCDVWKVGSGVNATFNDLINQVNTGISLHPEIERTERLNVHFARMGEPLFNSEVIQATYYLAGQLKTRGWGFHPVVSTMMPRVLDDKYCERYISDWLSLKNNLDGEAGLQISINATDELKRDWMFNRNQMSLDKISRIVNNSVYAIGVEGRKITLNFAVSDAKIDAEKLESMFSPEHYICKLTPMHVTKSCQKNNILTEDGYSEYYPYKGVEEELKDVGFGVIVFIPSMEEDESKITCGNAILAEQKQEDSR